jgi:hypothetical protein
MEDETAVRGRAANCLWVKQPAANHLDPRPLEKGRICPRADERAHAVASLLKETNEMAPEKPRRARDEDTHVRGRAKTTSSVMSS